MNGVISITEKDELIMKLVHYFVTKENYVISNTAFWGYAFVSEKTGWMDADDAEDQFAWMSTFYDLYIKNLDDDTLLTIFECTK